MGWMAKSSDNRVTSERPRTAGSGIVIAGDRTVSRRSAHRHSKAVRGLKYGLPLALLTMCGLYGLSVMKTIGWGSGMAALKIPDIIPENLAMENPHYEGFNKDGGRYWVTAATAQQDLKALNIIKLNTITGELTDAQKKTTTITAARGTFDNKANVLDLFETIDIAGTAGMSAKLTRATIKTKDNIITSDQPVVVTMEAGTINAGQMTVRQKSREYTFVENVRTHLNGQPADAAAEPAAKTAAQAFGSTGEAVDITSNRLDIDDTAKVATFTGSVTAVQGGASLTAPELEVNYEGSASAAPQAGATDGGGKVKRIVAKNPVVLKQATGEVVTTHSAEFDTVAQKAVLDGDVVMTQLPDKRAVGDRAELDQAANTILLTGAVVVTQGINELKGRRLMFNRATSKMQLTAAGGSGASSRVSARFQQASGKGSPTSTAATSDAAGQGIPFGVTFKTDPNAPINVEADRLDVDDVAKQAVFTGEVRATQGDFVIRSLELTATYLGSAGLSGTAVAGAAPQGAAQLNRIVARKKVQVTSKDGQSATGDWADFDPKANTATLGGDVVLTQGKNVIRGTKLIIDMTTGQSVIKTEPTSAGGGSPMISSSDGDGSGIIVKSGRPSAVFYPGELKSQGGAAAAKAANGALSGGAVTGGAVNSGAVTGWDARAAPSPRP